MEKKILTSLILFLILPLCSCGPHKYQITWKNDDGTILEVDKKVPFGETPTYDGATPTKSSDNQYSYTFESWSPSIEPVTGDETYIATYHKNLESIKITFNLNGGQSSHNNLIIYASTIDAKDFFFDVKKDNYNFRGWSFNDEKVFDQNGNLINYPEIQDEMTFTAIFAQDAFLNITTNFKDAAKINGAGYYEYNSFVDVSVETNKGFKFIGWYFEDTLLSNQEYYSYMMWNEDVTLEARFELNSYQLIVEAVQPEYGLVMIKGDQDYKATSSGIFEYKSSITIAALTKSTRRFLGWFDEKDTLVETNAVYTFAMRYENYHLYAKWEGDYYLLTVNTTYENSATVSGDGSYMYGDYINLTFILNKGFEFISWSYDGNFYKSENLKIRMPNKSFSVSLNVEPITYYINYELNGGSNTLNNPEFYNILSDGKLYEPTKTGYTFTGWLLNGEIIDTIPCNLCEDITLVATWSINSYKLNVISNNENAGTVSGGGTFEYNTEHTIIATTNNAYNFNGWYKDSMKVSSSESYNVLIGASDATFEARWTAIQYTITYNLDGGVNNSSNPTNYTIETSTITLKNPTKTGYTFIGWTLNGNKVTTIEKGTYGNLTLTANWSINSYKVTVMSSDTNKGTVTGGGTYSYGSDVTITATPKTGYELEGWYKSNTKVSSSTSYSFTLADSDVSFEARWTLVEYTITYNLNGGTNDSSNPSKYTIETPTITLQNPTYKLGTFVNWIDQNNNPITKIEKGTIGDISLMAVWNQTAEQKAEEEEARKAHFVNPVVSQDDKTVQYGMYPQSEVTDSSIVLTLNTKAGTKPTPSNSQNWTAYNYYIKSSNSTKFMWYIDIDLDIDGYNDYRGVYFTAYRPVDTSASSSLNNSNQDDNGYKINNVYWFKYEPITWRILQKSTGDYFLMSNVILDSIQYMRLTSEIQSCTDYQGNTANVYPNNYKYSDLRTFLNVDFYNCAFKTSDTSSIKVSTVDNSLSSTGSSLNSYTCENTNDKLFALSYEDVSNSTYGLSYSTRQFKSSEYAKCMGIYINTGDYPGFSTWWLRSPRDYYYYRVRVVDKSGKVGKDYTSYVDSTQIGVVPALHISI